MELTGEFLTKKGYTCNHPERVLKTFYKSSSDYDICLEEIYLRKIDRKGYSVSIKYYKENSIPVTLELSPIREIGELEDCLKLTGIK